MVPALGHGGIVMASGQPGSTSARNCISCGRSIAWDANVCPYCGHDFRSVMAGPAQGSTGKKFQGSLLALVLLAVFCWPAAIIYYFYKRE